MKKYVLGLFLCLVGLLGYISIFTTNVVYERQFGNPIFRPIQMENYEVLFLVNYDFNTRKMCDDVRITINDRAGVWNIYNYNRRTSEITTTQITASTDFEVKGAFSIIYDMYLREEIAASEARRTREIIINLVSSGVTGSLLLLSGIAVLVISPKTMNKISPKKRKLAVVFAAIPLTAMFGLDRFYRGYIWLGFVKLFVISMFSLTTYLNTMYYFAVRNELLLQAIYAAVWLWYIGDIVSAALKSSTDEKGRVLAGKYLE